MVSAKSLLSLRSVMMWSFLNMIELNGFCFVKYFYE